ncbi:integrase [Macrococcus sp. IME1552]|nr:site-specific integrase [Macrococcus sp. IME1552]ATD31642.1 integrase [Macrococcus sp. IME1552]
MWCEAFQDKNDITKYRFIEKYKDPLTDKWKRTSVVMNKNTKPSQKEAERQLNEKIEAIINDKSPLTLKTLTFHQACDEWLSHYISVSGSKRSTIKGKQSNTNRVKEEFEKDLLVSRINAQMIKDKLNEWAKLGKSRGNMEAYMIVIKCVLAYTKTYYGLNDISFINEIKIPKKAKTREEIQTKRNNFLEDHEVNEVLDCFDYKIKQIKAPIPKRNYAMVKNIIEFQILNGLRIGELLAIQVDNVDLKNKKLTIDGTIVWEHDNNTNAFGVKDTTKTEVSNRNIDLTNRSCDILRKVILQNKKSAMWEEHYTDRGFIFTNSSGSPMDTQKINNMYRSIVDLTSFKDKKVTTHTNRHTHISKLSQLGVSLKAIMNRVGHSDHRTTLQIYSHVTEKMDKEMMDKLESVGR